MIVPLNELIGKLERKVTWHGHCEPRPRSAKQSPRCLKELEPQASCAFRLLWYNCAVADTARPFGSLRLLCSLRRCLRPESIGGRPIWSKPALNRSRIH